MGKRDLENRNTRLKLLRMAVPDDVVVPFGLELLPNRVLPTGLLRDLVDSAREALEAAKLLWNHANYILGELERRAVDVPEAVINNIKEAEQKGLEGTTQYDAEVNQLWEKIELSSRVLAYGIEIGVWLDIAWRHKNDTEVYNAMIQSINDSVSGMLPRRSFPRKCRK